MQKITKSLFIACLIFLMTGCFSNNNKKIEERENNMELISKINVTIDNKKYNAEIYNNETAQFFANKLPESFNMKELNGNEKYIYLDYSLPTNSSNPKHIHAGDIMLYEDNCLVIFYKSFDTNYHYTKIGHINDLPDLKGENILVKFEK